MSSELDVNQKIDNDIKNASCAAIHFSLPGCKPCKTVLPLIEQMIKSYPDVFQKIVTVSGVGTTKDENDFYDQIHPVPNEFPKTIFFQNGKHRQDMNVGGATRLSLKQRVDHLKQLTSELDQFFYHMYRILGSILPAPIIRLIMNYARSFWFFGSTNDGIIYDPLTQQTWPYLYCGKPNMLLFLQFQGHLTDSMLLVPSHLESDRFAIVRYNIAEKSTINHLHQVLHHNRVTLLKTSNIVITDQIALTSQSLYVRDDNGLVCQTWQRFDLTTQQWKETIQVPNKYSRYQKEPSNIIWSVGIGPRSFIVFENILITGNVPGSQRMVRSVIIRCFTYEYYNDAHVIKEIELGKIGAGLAGIPETSGVIREGYDMVVAVLDSTTMLQFNIQSRCPLIVDKPRIVKFQEHEKPLTMLITTSNLWGVANDNKLFRFCFQLNRWIFFQHIGSSLCQFKSILGIV
jgi:thiol-disulfide isomerase/thioredoxin